MRIKTDVFIKQILRAFRAFIKKQFQDKYGRKYYYWIATTTRKNTKKFFIESSFNLSSQLYDQNEDAFMLLIHNTKTQNEIGALTKLKSGGNVIKLFKDTFG